MFGVEDALGDVADCDGQDKSDAERGGRDCIREEQGDGDENGEKEKK